MSESALKTFSHISFHARDGSGCKAVKFPVKMWCFFFFFCFFFEQALSNNKLMFRLDRLYS